MLTALSAAAFAATGGHAVQIAEVSALKQPRHPPPFRSSVEDGKLKIHGGTTSEYEAGYTPSWIEGGRGNMIQFLTNAIIHAEVEDLSHVSLDNDVYGLLHDEFFPNMPQEWSMSRTAADGRQTQSNATANCGDMNNYWACIVDIKTRADVAKYYWKKWLPEDCGDTEYQGLTIHLRQNPMFDWTHGYRQPPCDMYAETIKKHGFKKVRIYGPAENGCIKWLKPWASKNEVELQDKTGRDVLPDFCEAIGARNLFLGVSTFSQNAVLIGGTEGRRIFSMVPTVWGDPFLFFGWKEQFPSQMCDAYNGSFSGVKGIPSDYWSISDQEYWQQQYKGGFQYVEQEC